MITKRELKQMGAKIPDSEIIEEYQQEVEDYKEIIAVLEDQCRDLREIINDRNNIISYTKALCDQAATALCEYDSVSGKEILRELENV